MRRAFLKRARRAIADETLQRALDRNAERRLRGRALAFASLKDPRALRDRAAAIRRDVVKNLDSYLVRFIAAAEANRIHVHLAQDARQACDIAIDIARGAGAHLIAKSKSMLSEEIGFNHALGTAGFQAVETDLGEFIVQLRGERPGHLITPAIHLLKEQVAETFTAKLGMPYSTDIATITAAARRRLRSTFLEAEVGVSGVNFGVVETGTLCLVTNEGNGRMVTTLPRVHIALMGIERMVPSLDNLAVMLALLPRSGTGQILTSYVSLIQGPRGEHDPDGPQARHLVLIDNSRRRMASSPLAEALACIRCGACLNACPVFREIGGHAYDSVYPGPIGALLSPGLFGVERYGHLAKASTLCGACSEVCPVGIDFPKLLLRVRRSYARQVPQPLWLRWGLRAYAWLASDRARFRFAQRLAAHLLRRESWTGWLPGPLAKWTAGRDFPPFTGRPLRERVQPAAASRIWHPPVSESHPPPESAQPAERERDPAEQFIAALRKLGGEAHLIQPQDAPHAIASRLRDEDVQEILVESAEGPVLSEVLDHLRAVGLTLRFAEMPHRADEDRRAVLAMLDHYEVGITGAAAAIAESGTLILPSGPGKSSLASLLPRSHIAALARSQIFPTMEAWLRAGGADLIRQSPVVTLISGPSRTADIEMSLTIGVHGPARVVVYIFE